MRKIQAIDIYYRLRDGVDNKAAACQMDGVPEGVLYVLFEPDGLVDGVSQWEY